MNQENQNLLFREVKQYRTLSSEFQSVLSRNPDDLQSLQERFNTAVERISVDILNFEKENMLQYESKVYQLKRIFENRYRRFFLFGEYPKWVYAKPFGYAGDFKIIDNIYKNSPISNGFDRLWDNYFLQMTASKATRIRKEDLKRFIKDFIQKNSNRPLRIMNLASGPAREIKELHEENSRESLSDVNIDCYDFDNRAIEYAKNLLDNVNNVNFYQKNAIRLALKKDITKEIPYKYDFIYSAGLLDYFDDRVSVSLIKNLRCLLNEGGVMVIANFGDKFENTSAGLMEWATEWYLIYRKPDELISSFLNAGFKNEDLEVISQPSRVIHYCLARNN
jgi:extracellular factor (EF) 3-hydroxypalmitic acid methyl ester biosynthesis protein